MTVLPAEASSLRELLLGVDHVGVAVAELEPALARWALLGFVEEHREQNDDQRVVEVMLVAPAATGEGCTDGSSDGSADAAVRLQLLAPAGPDSPITRFLDRRGPGLQQLAVRVTDVVLAAERLSAAGLRVLYPEPRPGTAGSKINFIHPADVGGVLVELVQPGFSAR